MLLRKFFARHYRARRANDRLGTVYMYNGKAGVGRSDPRANVKSS
jgi:hypothetical protein